ncbi:MAG: hypothetical protein HQM08_04995 [Candidatus Riflebacteria bacterium]|nr:hypothetical protein [Candidatus Riflebacteria bacterium]
MNKSAQTLFFISAFLMALIGIYGCGSTDNGITTDLPSGSGYKIKMTSSESSVRPGGGVLIRAIVFGPDGKPIPDNELVRFTCDTVGTFEGLSDGQAKTVSGIATVNFIGPDTTDKLPVSQPARVYAAYNGAISSIELVLVSKSF